MNYTKPEVNTLGDAKVVIEKMGIKPVSPLTEPRVHPTGEQPASDLDE